MNLILSFLSVQRISKNTLSEIMKYSLHQSVYILIIGKKVFLIGFYTLYNQKLTSFQVAGVSYSDEIDERLDRGVGNRGREGIGGGLGGGDSWGSDLHDDPV